MDSLVTKSLRRSNTTLIILSTIALIVGIVGLVLTTIPYFVAKFTGPTSITTKDLVSTEVNFIQPLYFREVTGEDMLDTGYEEYTYDSDTGRRVSTDAYFGALYLGGGRFLLVRTPDAIDENQITLVGSLIEIPGDIQREVVDDLLRELGGDADNIQFLPMMLDQNDNQVLWYVGTAIVAVLIIFGLRGVIVYIQRQRDPHKHPAFKKLARYGDVDMVVGSIEQELAMAEEPIGKRLYLTRSWVVYAQGGTFQATRLEDLIWLYKHSYRTRYSTNYQAHYCDKHGNLMAVPASKKNVDEMLQVVYDRAPWAIAGHTKEVSDAYKKDRQQLIAAVEQRKAKIRSGAASA